ncbi:FAD/NAD(P)-binding oxidoreductase [Methylobacterium sp. 77]|uniref:NAD(P)/FAD-dependent oxidoreductase n=1 Tax=Methylobacterium sp. 77 TaxID=1101192 RepID=UPI00035C4C2D|nr:FAD/NAD(P)-binding oxidoreductase [Methylobacterium sp. 77]
MTEAMIDGHAVVVGASLAGLRGAESLRRSGFAGRLTLVGDEAHRPYDRPPLSKSVLTGEVAPEATRLPNFHALDAEWRLGIAASGLDRDARTIRLADGSTLAYDRLLIATGSRARSWPNPAEAGLIGVHTLRGRDDADALRRALSAGPKRVLIIGAGFIGCEVAASCRALDLAVTLIDPGPAPLARILGQPVGEIVAALHRTLGVDLRSRTKVERLEGDTAGRVVRAILDDGRSVETDVVVVALGAVRNTEWLHGSGLDVGPGGLACDAAGHALDTEGRPDTAIAAAGDVARFPHPLYDGRPVALEHWGHAVAQGEHAGRLLAGMAAGTAYAEMPAFWSSQGGITIKSVGLTEGADAMVFAQGNPKEGRFVVVYGREGRCIAAVSFDSARWLPAYAERIAARAPFPPIRGGTDEHSLTVLAPGFPEVRTSP